MCHACQVKLQNVPRISYQDLSGNKFTIVFWAISLISAGVHERLSYIIYQGTDILPEIFSSSPDRRVFAARKLHEGFSPRVILSDKHECWTARKNFWRYISVPRYIRKRIARKNFSLGQLYRKFSLGKIFA
jgi:hypothetical protein